MPERRLTQAALLVAMFAAAELALLHIEFRQEAYSFSLSGVPLTIGALTVSPTTLVVTRLVGTAIAFAIQRPNLNKVIYNGASYAFEAALVGAATCLLTSHEPGLGLSSSAAVTGMLLVTDAVMSALVLRVISWHSGTLDQREQARVFVSGATIALLTSLLGVTTVIVLGRGILGLVVLLGLLAVFVVVHRAFAALHRRHASLELVHDFVSRDTHAVGVDDLVGESLAHICRSMRATRVSMVLDGWEGRRRLVVVDREFARWDGLTDDWQTDVVLGQATSTGAPVVVSRNTNDPVSRAWLAQRSMRDAVVVPVIDGEGVIGTLLVADRQGETATFTADDVPVAQTLAAHMAVAMRSAAMVERLRHEATHDALTGIGNRALLSEALERIHETPGAHGTLAALLLLDLDRFKDVNDVLGHEAGDRLLSVVAQRLTAFARGGLVARLGGDEFAILLTGVASPREAELFAEQAIATLKKPVFVNGIALNADASIGVAVFRPGEVSPGELLRQADLAMYGVKGTGRAVGLYTQDLERGHADRLALVADLRLAIDRDQLFMLYQPKMALDTRTILGLEALIRWEHPKLGRLAPDTFIPLAESAGLIDAITDIALRLSLTQCRAWHDQGLDLSVAVNLSAHNLHDDKLPQRVADLLGAVGLPASALTLEITEGSVVSEPERTIPVLHALADLGCTISLDDFGTGYSSLSYLQNLPVQEVKIDRSFVTDFVGDKRRETLVAAIIGLGESLQLRVVAEGIEDAATENELRRMGCDEIQGYFLGPPTTPAQLELLLERSAARIVSCEASTDDPLAPAGTVVVPREGAAAVSRP